MAQNALPNEAMASAEASDRQLRKALSFWELFCLSMGGIIGSGWLFASFRASTFAGPAVLLSWVIGGLLILFIALNFAEISGMLPRSGAIVRYPHLTHGSYTGYLMAWAYFLTGVMIPVIEAVGVITYTASYAQGLATASGTLTPLGIAFALGLTILFFALNYFGIKLLGRLNLIVTVWKFVIPILTFIFLFFLFQGSNLTVGTGGFAPFGFTPILQAIPLTGIVFSYLGFRQALEYGGEGKNPQRDVPRATIFCVLAAIVLYTFLQLGFLGAVNWGALHITPGDWAALKGTGLAKGPLASLMTSSGLALLVSFAVLLQIDAAISPSGTGLVYIGTGARSIYGSAVDGYLPGIFQKMNKWGVPIWSLVATVVLGWVVLLPFPNWYTLVGVISSAQVLTYVMGGVGLMVLRRTASNVPRTYRLPAAGIMAPLGFISAALVVFWTGTNGLDIVVLGVFVGLPIYGWFYGVRTMNINPIGAIVSGVLLIVALIVTAYYGDIGTHQLSFVLYWFLQTLELALYSLYLWFASHPEKRHDIWRATWLFALIQGLYLLSYFTSFGPQKAPPITFPLDTIIAIIFSLICFYFGAYSGYQTEEIAEIDGRFAQSDVQAQSAD